MLQLSFVLAPIMGDLNSIILIKKVIRSLCFTSQSISDMGKLEVEAAISS